MIYTDVEVAIISREVNENEAFATCDTLCYSLTQNYTD